MFKSWRLRTRLIVTYVSLILLGFAGLSLLAGNQIAAGAVEDFERSLQTQAELVARNLREPIEHFAEGEGSFASMQTAVTSLANDFNLQITLIGPDGFAWLSSDPAVGNANFGRDPEVAAVISGSRTVFDTRDNAQHVPTIYTAVPITEDGYLFSVIRVAAPASATASVVSQRYLALAAGVLGLTGLAVLAALWLAASFTRPLVNLQNSAMKLAAGDLTQRVPVDRQDELGKLAETFNHMAEQVEAMLLEQKAFASNASHELRTPLTTIRLRSEALRDGTLDEAIAQQYVAEIDDEVARLGQLVNDLIQLSRFDSGRAEIGHELIDPVRLGRSLCQQMEQTAVAKQISLTFAAPNQLPNIQANQSHLRIVLQNLLGNAIKYTPTGGQVTWRLSQEDGYLRSDIADTGIGLAPEDAARLFERFYRADKAHTRATGGTGLGLPLAKSIVEFYHGRIQLQSDGPGQGTTATVWWPLPKS
ncbi:MAG: HAMP domain-containing protein [Ardenticatenaceae bacterium]|nr:HAMP domain-containing protein [Anaerolineales bacterium]MCB8937734.1 HAMP domain-containing protein [Ardenticatenaceae bacterium]MCB8974303.1 HAMP domain-containing protein [Ardenticatenaceae bacterium]